MAEQPGPKRVEIIEFLDSMPDKSDDEKTQALKEWLDENYAENIGGIHGGRSITDIILSDIGSYL